MILTQKKTIKKIASRVIIAIALLIGSIPIVYSTSAYAAGECDTVYYSNNDVLYYNPCETCTSGGGTLTGNSNEEKTFKWLIGREFNAAQAAGIMGNINTESSFNPFRMQTTYANSGIEVVLPPKQPGYNYAFGLVQWDGGRRLKVLEQIAAKFPDHVELINTHGKSADGYKEAAPEKNDQFLTFELEFMYQELSNGYTSVFDQIKAQPDTEEGVVAATEIWNRKYEVSADYSQDRHEKAKEYYAQFKDLAPSTSSSSDSSSSGGECSSGEPAGEISWYSQCDDRWSTLGYAGEDMCAVGCGPSSMAIILASLIDKNITPADVAAVAGAQSGGTSSWVNLVNGVNDKWGANINTTPMNFSEAVEYVKSGKGYVWLGGGGPPPFTGGGHMVAMVGVTSDGQVTIADPWGGRTSGGGMHENIANYSVEQIDAAVGSGIFGVPKR